MKIDWNCEYSLGIAEIDAQHEKLVTFIAHLIQMVDEKKTWGEIHFALINLLEFAKFHFAFEEALMRMYAYPEASEHMRLHQDFIERVNYKLKQSLSGEVEIELVHMLCDWFMEHIRGVDKGYAQHILSGAKVVSTSSVA